MNDGAQARPSTDSADQGRVALAGLIIALSAVTAWSNSFGGAFVFDDLSGIVNNSAIRHLRPLGDVLFPAQVNLTVSGRPLLGLTLAINYTLGGLNVWGYHALNLAIHVLAGLTVFGIVRRTLTSVGRHRRLPPNSYPPGFRDPALQDNATFLAFAIALLWTLHPLQTESVTYLVQRAESLMGLFYLLTLYCFIRGAEGTTVDGTKSGGGLRRPRPATDGPVVRGPWCRGPVIWFACSILACLLGMAAKEVMVTAPVIVLLYDRVFVAGSYREAWRRRGWVHAGLMATWLPLAWFVAGTGWSRGQTAGFGSAAGPWEYWLTQLGAVVHYLRLALWPHPLVADHGMALTPSFSAVWWQGLVLLALLVATVWALAKRPRLGFLGAWFFAILTPTSLVPVATQTVAEHRMYLPLAAVIALAVVGVHRLLGRRSLPVFLALAAGLAWLTLKRNGVYRSEFAFWRDVAAHSPTNARARSNLGNILLEQGHAAAAVPWLEAALRIQPDLPDTESSLCRALTRLDRLPEALAHGEKAVKLDPASGYAHLVLGEALMRQGRTDDATAHYATAVRLQPGALDARFALATAFATAGRYEDAAAQYREITRLDPGDVRARSNLGSALMMLGRLDEAVAAYEAALRLDPGNAAVRQNLELARSLQAKAAGRP